MRVQALLQTKQGLSPMQSWQNSSDKKTPQEIAIERHARRDAVAVQGLRSVSCRVLCIVNVGFVYSLKRKLYIS